MAFSPAIQYDPRDVPVTQVREFAPEMTIGGSATDLPLLALALLRTTFPLAGLRAVGRDVGIYYAAVRGSGVGRVRVVPGMSEPLVSYSLPTLDLRRLRAALGRLMLVLLAAGAERVVPSMKGGEPVRRPEEIAAQVRGLDRRTAEVMTVHMCSSVPMGEKRDICAVDSFGASHEVAGLRVSDASIVNGAPGINPQGTVMALAVRNAEQYLRSQAQVPGPRILR